MKLAFYYHIPMRHNTDGNILMPSYLGVFIDSLATYVEELCLIMHESDEQDTEADYVLQGKNIKWVSLGKKTPAWHRAIFYGKILKEPLRKIEDYDILLVRSPSPLAPYFGKYLKGVKLMYMIVGDYNAVVQNMKTDKLREKLIKYFLIYNNWLFEKQIKSTSTIVNSPQLLEKYKFIAPKIQLIKTTTLGEDSFFYRKDTCNKSTINILYTGRIEVAKGLFELLEAISVLRSQNFNVILNIAGKEHNNGKEIVNLLVKKAKILNVEKQLIFHGWKSLGFELNEMYQKSDIYVIPSYHEGFPRTIWEAMANSLPVIATDVGAIPYYLKNEISALIIKPKEINPLVIAIKKIIENRILRQAMIKNGFELAQEVTQEKQMKIVVEFLKV